MKSHFTIHARQGHARTGTLRTPHGEIRTPAFMPVGTAATVKAMHPEHVKATGADVILGNTYHLMLRPTAERLARLGGLHQFMRWDGPILTDSGGFQVMSLSGIRKITEEGVRFNSHLDGSVHMLTPERSMEIQHLLGADITMIFDECTPYPATHKVAQKSMELSLRWAERSHAAFNTLKSSHLPPLTNHLLFGIVQGSVYEDLREQSAKALGEMGFHGMAIGGLAVGEGQAEMFRVLDFTIPHVPDSLPHYLMGVGKPDDIVGAVLRGIDMFDCVIPTRSGRNAQAFTWEGTVNLRNAKHAEDNMPLNPKSTCPASRDYSKAYLHHLFKAGEMLGPMLLTWHNLHFYQELVQEIRTRITAGTFTDWAEGFILNYGKKPSTA